MPSEKIDVLDIIKQHFKYIYKDLINEYPDIKLYGKYNLLKEIVIDNLVVGFSLYSFEDDFKVGKMYLEYYYVLHEYRDRFNLYDDIFEAWEYGQFLVSIHNPKRETIELLIKERKACMLNDRFVLS